jgi:hypothetical protein
MHLIEEVLLTANGVNLSLCSLMTRAWLDILLPPPTHSARAVEFCRQFSASFRFHEYDRETVLNSASLSVKRKSSDQELEQKDSSQQIASQLTIEAVLCVVIVAFVLITPIDARDILRGRLQR